MIDRRGSIGVHDRGKVREGTPVRGDNIAAPHCSVAFVSVFATTCNGKLYSSFGIGGPVQVSASRRSGKLLCLSLCVPLNIAPVAPRTKPPLSRAIPPSKPKP